MDFGKYIHELLLENEIVVVPGFGAFVSEYKPAEINENIDEIKPPSKIVGFNPQIRNNDGLLVGHVAEVKRLSHYDALKSIEKERENILYRLDNGEEVELKGVGILFHSKENTIGFRLVQDENLLLDSFGLETTSFATSIEDDEHASKGIIEELPVVEEEATETTISDKKIIEEEEVAEDQTVKKPAPTPEHEISTQEEEEQKKKAWLWYLLILIPLIAVSAFIFINGKQHGDSDKQESTLKIIEQPAIVPQDTAKSDTIEVAISDTTYISEKDTVLAEPTKPEPTVASDPNAPKYYLVGGSFSVKDNAETYLLELKAKGFDAFHVGKKGRFFIVGIGTYNTFNEADQAKKEYMTNNPGSEVWVWKK